MVKAYRRKLGPFLVQAHMLPFPTVIKSGEGIGKTRILAGILAAEAFDHALEELGRNYNRQEFYTFAFRSRQQAEAKAKEFRANGRSAVAISPFWEHLRIVCEEMQVPPITKDTFDPLSLPSILVEIERRDKRVYDLMEERRRNLWVEARFDDGVTLLTMTHKAGQAWTLSQITRAWHHPEFRPEADVGECERLAKEFYLNETACPFKSIFQYLRELKVFL